VEERLVLAGISFLLTDTAGIREHPEPVEEEGIRRSLEKIRDADLVIAVLDGSAPLDGEDAGVLERCTLKETVVVLNKMDLGVVVPPDDRTLQLSIGPRISVSAKTGEGIDSLGELIEEIGVKKAKTETSQTAGSLNRRGILLVEAAAIPITKLLNAYERGEEVRPEIVSLELRQALSHLQEITGEAVEQGVLDRIFERFCVGK
jgi:tRNA modification GTPase